MAHAVVRTVADAVPGRRIVGVTLRIGVSSGVVPQALTFAWDVAVTGTALAGSRLWIERVPLGVKCRDCGATSEAHDLTQVRCAECSSRAVDVVAGRELEIATVEVEDDDDATDGPPADLREPATEGVS
jgi:hydrogenase nickel incorporation protein HypA/HybF